MVAENGLQTYLGKSIAQICDNGFSSPSQNHCAHFVSHVMSLKLGILCGDMAWKTRRTGASIRCNELYNKLRSTGHWDSRPNADDGILIFVLSARHVPDGVMRDVPRNHVGIHINGRVYHYSNSQQRVVVDATLEQFHERFKSADRNDGDDISLFFGAIA